MQLKHRRGEIGADVVAAVHNINGHSSAVAANYYNRIDRVADVHAARNLFNPVSNLPTLVEHRQEESHHPASIPVLSTSPAAAIPIATSFATHSTYKRQFDWGTEHPYYNDNTSTRIPWSDAEKEYVMEWKEANLQCHEDRERAISRCLVDIKADPAAHPIFHQHHVLTPQRLRNGFEQRKRTTQKRSLYETS